MKTEKHSYVSNTLNDHVKQGGGYLQSENMQIAARVICRFFDCKQPPPVKQHLTALIRMTSMYILTNFNELYLKRNNNQS